MSSDDRMLLASSESESKDEMEGRHRKEIKAFEGEHRASLKKAKSTKGKKAKDEVAALEADFERRLQQMKERHVHELRQLEDQGNAPATHIGLEEESTAATHQAHSGGSVGESHAAAVPSATDGIDESDLDRQRRNEKARKKREKAREKERERERLIEEELANAGPSARDVENDVIQEQLAPLHLTIREVAADGHCLYRAVAAHYDNDKKMQYTDIRKLCADALATHENEFGPFCELSDDAPTYEAYVERVRSSAEWGGHLELRALSLALKRPVIVYSAQSSEPLRIDEETHGDAEPIRLSYHRSYYALGEHYNQVVSAGAASST